MLIVWEAVAGMRGRAANIDAVGGSIVCSGNPEVEVRRVRVKTKVIHEFLFAQKPVCTTILEFKVAQ